MSSRLNILFVTSWYPSEQDPTNGIFVKDYAKAAALHNNVIVLSVGDKSWTLKSLCNTDVAIEDGIKTIRLTHKNFRVSKITAAISMLNALRYMFKIRRGGFLPDIVHANIYASGVSSVIFGKLTGTKVIVTEHWSGYARHLLGSFEAAKARFALGNADMILPVSQALQHSIEDFGVKGRFRIVPNVIDTRLFKLNADKKMTTDNVKRILIAADQIPVKGIPNAIEALKRLKLKRSDFILNIFGDGENRAEYENLVVSYGLENHVKFHGFQPKPLVARFMRKSDFLVLPSHFETFGCVVVEAMASGIPVVASRVGGVPALVPEYAGILVEPDNIDELSRAIENMLDNSSSYPKNDMFSYAKTNFSPEVVGEKLNEVYREIVNAR